MKFYTHVLVVRQILQRTINPQIDVKKHLFIKISNKNNTTCNGMCINRFNNINTLEQVQWMKYG